MINKKYIRKKIWPFLVSLGGAVVMLLAFLIPSLQDQWDRFQSRKVIEQYVAIGDNLFDENHFTMAETAYQKAFELSAEQRLDIDVKRLNARVNRILENETWGSKPPDDLQEIDFQFLLHTERGQNEVADRVATLNSYGIFLAAGKRRVEAQQQFDEAIRIDPKDVLAYVNKGNLLDEYGEKGLAEEFYMKALAIDKSNGRTHYNLGMLYWEQRKIKEAVDQVNQAIEADEKDSVAVNEYKILLKKMVN